MKTFLTLLSTFVIHAAVHAQPAPCPQVSRIVMDRGTFRSQPGVVFGLRRFNATLVPLGRTAPACYQKMTVVAHAEIFVSNESLTHVFAEKLDKAESKINGFNIENGEGKVTLTGRITRLVPIDFTIEGPVSTDGTSILLDAGKIKADGIPVKMLLGLIGEHLNNILGMKNVDGVAVHENQLSFSPELIAHLKGHIQSVETSANGLTLRYSTVAHLSPSPQQ